MNSYLSYCRLVDPRISASEKDLPVSSGSTFLLLYPLYDPPLYDPPLYDPPDPPLYDPPDPKEGCN